MSPTPIYRLDNTAKLNRKWNSINNPIDSKKRKLENREKDKQTVQDNPFLSATDKMSNGEHASTCTCHTIPSAQIAVHFA